MTLLELQDVRKSYGDRVVLADVDLTVARHDVVCLIGSSGSGKWISRNSPSAPSSCIHRVWRTAGARMSA